MKKEITLNHKINCKTKNEQHKHKQTQTHTFTSIVKEIHSNTPYIRATITSLFLYPFHVSISITSSTYSCLEYNPSSISSAMSMSSFAW